MAILAWVSLAPPANAATPIADHASHVTAIAGYLAWSRLDPATDRWYLMTRGAGVTRQLPLPPQPDADSSTLPSGTLGIGPFDANLGIGPRGRPLLAYSRCAAPEDGCNIYTYDLRSGRERRLPASTKKFMEFVPSVSGKRVVFMSRPAGPDTPPEAFWSRLDGSRHSLPLIICPSLLSHCIRTPSLDLLDGLVALSAGDALSIAALGWPTPLTAGRSQTGEDTLDSVSLDAGGLFYGFIPAFDGRYQEGPAPPTEIHRVDLRTGLDRAAVLEARLGIDSVAGVGGRAYYIPSLGGTLFDAGQLFEAPRPLATPPPLTLYGESKRVTATRASYCWTARGHKRCSSRSARSVRTLVVSPGGFVGVDLGTLATDLVVRRAGVRRPFARAEPGFEDATIGVEPPFEEGQTNIGQRWVVSLPERIPRTVHLKLHVRYPEGRASFAVRLRRGR